MVNMLSERELTLIEDYIDEYGVTDEMECGRTVNAKYILREWARAKSEYLNKMFGDQLILSKEITFKMADEQLDRELETKLYHGEFGSFFNELERLRFDRFHLNDNVYWGLSDLFGIDSLRTNIYSGETFEIPVNNEKPIKINRGTKSMKAIAKIAKAFGMDMEVMEKIRIAHSQCLNQKELKGELCISIHPFDYMTMSDNDCGWSSCMSWFENGCYRQGTVEMMNSPMVVVAYLRAKNDMKVCGETWNNKKWRELYVVTPELITNIKAYPYKNSIITKEVLAWLKELATKAFIGTYDNDTIEWEQNKTVNFKNRSYNIIGFTNNMYNDLDRHQIGYIGDAYPDNEGFEFCYSGAAECMTCGELNPSFSSEGYVVGECCDEAYYCDSCGDRHRREDLIEFNGSYYCQYCYDDNIIMDEITGEYVHVDNATRIHLCDKEKMYTNFSIWVSDETLNNEDFLKTYFKDGKYFCDTFWWRNYYFFSFEQLTDEGAKLFGFNNVKELIEEKMRLDDNNYADTRTLHEDVGTDVAEALRTIYERLKSAS